MQGGFFGKMPAKADFVSGNCPAGFLRLWEPFLEKGLGRSRLDLSDAWEDAYMTMPVWRFLLKPDAPECPLDAPLAGAIMPSVDRVGRKFPLTLVAALGGAAAQGGPDRAWYDELETILLRTLDEEAGLAELQTSLATLKEPENDATPDEPPQFERLSAATGGDVHLSASFWCRAGKGGYSFRSTGLPRDEDFRWLILPERYRPEDAGITTGQNHPEDHRT